MKVSKYFPKHYVHLKIISIVHVQNFKKYKNNRHLITLSKSSMNNKTIF